MMISGEHHTAALAEFRRAALILQGGHGIPLHEVLIIAHAWSLTEMASSFGPTVATECATAGLKRLEEIPVGPKLATSHGAPVRGVQ